MTSSFLNNTLSSAANDRQFRMTEHQSALARARGHIVAMVAVDKPVGLPRLGDIPQQAPKTKEPAPTRRYIPPTDEELRQGEKARDHKDKRVFLNMVAASSAENVRPSSAGSCCSCCY